MGLVAKELFNKLGIENKFFYEMCCGMPQLEGGDIKSVTNKAKETKTYLSFGTKKEATSATTNIVDACPEGKEW